MSTIKNVGAFPLPTSKEADEALTAYFLCNIVSILGATYHLYSRNTTIYTRREERPPITGDGNVSRSYFHRYVHRRT